MNCGFRTRNGIHTGESGIILSEYKFLSGQTGLNGFFEADASLQTKHNNPMGLKFNTRFGD